MRLTLTLIGLVAALVFGMLTVLDGMQTAVAGDDGDNTGDDAQVICDIDDGDDDEEPPDLPGQDDPNEIQEPITGGGLQILPPGDIGDIEDEDPLLEEDDCPLPTPPGFCGNMSEPGAYLFTEHNYGGACLHLTQDTPRFTDICTPDQCSWNDVASSIKLVEADVPLGVYLCLHVDYQGNCEFIGGDLPDLSVLPNEDCGFPCSLDDQSSSLYFVSSPRGDPGSGGDAQASYAAADADCDGGVNVSDALANLQYLSGFEAGCVGDWNGQSYQGDADCSGGVDGGDVTAILTAVINGSAADC